MNAQLIVSLFLVAKLWHSVYGDEDVNVGNGNIYVDEVLEGLRNNSFLVSQLEPIDIPGIDEGKFRISDGEVYGISSLYRHGNCTLDYKNETVFISAELAVKDVAIYVKYSAKALFFWISGAVNMTIDNFAVRMDVSGREGQAHLDSFKVTHLGDYRITHITGMTVLLNWLLKLIVNSVARKSREVIINAMEDGVATAVGGLLEKYKLPF